MAIEDLSNLKIHESVKRGRVVKRKRPFLWSFLILLAIIAVVLYQGGYLSPVTSVAVSTVSLVYPSQGFSLLHASGYVVAQRKASVASKATGRLAALMVEEGSRVKKDEVIARLENEDLLATRDQVEANLNALRANLDQAGVELEETAREYERNKRLLTERIIARSQFDTSETRYRRASAALRAAEASVRAGEAALQGARVALDFTEIKAPFDGVVLTKNADVGDIVTPLGAAANAKAAVVTMADLESLQVEVDVSETSIGQVKKGQPCEIQLDAFPELRFRGEVHAIVPTVDRSKASVMVKVSFRDKNPLMLPDMSAKVAFLQRPIQREENRPRSAVHHSALVMKGEENFLFVVHGERVKEVRVKTGITIGDMVEVLSGVAAGEKVVVRPPKDLKENEKIKVAEK